jgi:hypothetical protein
MKAKWVTGLGIAMVALALITPAMAAERGKKEKDHSADQIKKDIGDHRAMAEAHLNAARCFESGESPKDCHAQLAKDCKGLGIGKYCGMKHQH